MVNWESLAKAPPPAESSPASQGRLWTSNRMVLKASIVEGQKVISAHWSKEHVGGHHRAEATFRLTLERKHTVEQMNRTQLLPRCNVFQQMLHWPIKQHLSQVDGCNSNISTVYFAIVATKDKLVSARSLLMLGDNKVRLVGRG